MGTQMLRKPSASSEVNKYMKTLNHPLTDVVQALREIILDVDPEMGEEIKWNAPSFSYAGKLEPSEPKLYRRYLVVFNLFRKDSIRLVCWGGAKVKDTSGFLQGAYEDGRRLAMFSGMDDVKSQQQVLRNVVKRQLRILTR